jgi:nitrate reductase cytochrome c-type subunit
MSKLACGEFVMRWLFIFVMFLSVVNAKYLDNHSCKECHEKIYDEYESSYHSKTYFTDELHRKIANKVDKNRYECAVCHMPMANNLKDLISGKAKVNPDNPTHSDGVSCYFCHTIGYVKKSHKFNINLPARQAKGYKPSLFARLDNPDESDKHSSLSNPIYAKMVCKGCHSHKLNDYNTTIFRAMGEKQDSLECIKCHMPQASGGAEKMDKRARGVHISHKFLGIHDREFRKKGVDIEIGVKNGTLNVTLQNKMAHPLIIQPARAKYLKIDIKRGDSIVWKNYKKSPKEDREGYFAYSFKRDNHTVIIPANATDRFEHNLNAKESKTISYKIPELKKGDKIEVALYLRLAKSDCLSVIELEDANLKKEELIKKVSLIFK